MTQPKVPAPTVQTASGTLRGLWEESDQIAVFKGIPYAKPPVGALRWTPPQPPEPWQGVREATKFSPTSWQRLVDFAVFGQLLVDGQGWNIIKRTAFKWLLNVAPTPNQDEDCLYLNVRTPSLDPEVNLPVMVWIHGGDHQDGSGSAPLYVSNAFPRKEVVYVSINYRLGLMGYFAHADLTSESVHGVSGNYGTLDQIAALQWVQENIINFGGDPSNVTIFGESAGGESVAHMMTSPLSRGLFHSAIMQSPANGGQMMHLFDDFEHHPSGERRGQLFAERIGVGSQNTIEQLRLMPASELYTKMREEKEYGTFYPLIDGYVLPQSPFTAFYRSAQTQVPLLIGSNADEGTLISPILAVPLIEHRLAEISRESGDAHRALVEKEAFGTGLNEELTQLYQLYPGLDPSLVDRGRQAENDYVGDDMFGSKAYFYAAYAAKAGQPTYFYHFARTPPSPTQTAGAYHGAELPFIHGSRVPILPLQTDDISLSRTMIDYWTEFARSGDPNGSGRSAWAPFHADDAQSMYLAPNDCGMQPIKRIQKYNLLNQRTFRQIQAMDALRSPAI